MARRTGSFPRKEKERFETPPLTLTPGQRRLISRVDSMKALANSLCSSMPVATARMLGSMMIPLGEQPVRTLRDLDLAFDVVGLTAFVEAHHDDGRAVAAQV
jgi:hypothetical protein